MSTMRFDEWRDSNGVPVTDKDSAQTDFGG
jgi:hypothetical protein